MRLIPFSSVAPPLGRHRQLGDGGGGSETVHCLVVIVSPRRRHRERPFHATRTAQRSRCLSSTPDRAFDCSALCETRYDLLRFQGVPFGQILLYIVYLRVIDPLVTGKPFCEHELRTCRV